VNAGREWFGEPAELDFQKVNNWLGGKRTFYYDCLPAQIDNENAGEYNTRCQAKEAFFDRLRALPGWHVSEGTAKWKKKRGSTQKEVDILIAVDMLTHAYRKNMDQIIFVAGDLDFRPLVDAIVHEGMFISLRYGRDSVAKYLKDSADMAMEIDPFVLFGMCTRSFQGRFGLPERSWSRQPPTGDVLELGYCRGELAARLHEAGNFFSQHTICQLAEREDNSRLHYRDTDVRRLKRIYESCHGPIEWKPAAAQLPPVKIG
jgi:uncharacterized LabA/DUF88 family protein